MSINPIIFIAFNISENLGIGYMRACLSESGFSTRIIDIREGKKTIFRKLKHLNPKIVGFSVIFQSHFKQFTDLAAYLRKEGITCHFTAGGHYATLRYNDLFETIPSLDSIVRFEGESTMVELAKCIFSGVDWRKTCGLVYTIKEKIISNPLRPVERDLDKLPFPVRPKLREYAFGLKFASILAGRGCVHNCSFCSSKEYFRQMPGPNKRIRNPHMVVKEMEHLLNREECSIFMFDDDDFPILSKNNSDWPVKFSENLNKAGLNKKILWKINCRADEVDEVKFRQMKKNGLFHVFIGIEDGTDIGLIKMKKHTTVKQNLESINTLRKLNIGFDYGFMLFQPDTTFDSLRENLGFLTKICADGYTPVSFLKMLPLYESDIEKELMKQGRLKVINGQQDYCFCEQSMDDYFNFVMDCFSEWLYKADGVENISKWAINFFAVYYHYFDVTPEIKKIKRRVRKIISESNIFLIDTMKELSVIFETDFYKNDLLQLENFRKIIKSKHDHFKYLLNYNMGDFLQTVYFQYRPLS